MAKPEVSIPGNENPTPGQKPSRLRDQVKRIIAEVAQGCLRLGLAAGLLGGAAYFLSQYHREPAASVPKPAATPALTPAVSATPTFPATPTPAAAPTAAATPTPLEMTAATPIPIPQPTPIPSPAPVPASPLPNQTPGSFEDGMERVLRAGSSGFSELRGKLTKTETGSGPYALFRFRKIYEGTVLFGGAYSAQLEEVYYTKANRPVYNYHLYFQESSDQGSKYGDLRSRLDQLLPGFVHTYGSGYDAWADSDSRGTAVLLNSRDVSGSVEVQVHETFDSPQW